MDALLGSPDLLTDALTGALLAGLICWLFRLHLKLPTALCIGAVSRCSVFWVLEHLAPPTSMLGVADSGMTAMVTLAILVVAHLIAAR